MFEAKSSILSIINQSISNPKDVNLWDIFTPWHIIVNKLNNTITVKKRNWFLIGYDEKTYLFHTVRNIEIDNHLFGSTIKIKVYAGKVVAYCIPKKDSEEIRNLYLYNEHKNTKFI